VYASQSILHFCLALLVVVLSGHFASAQKSADAPAIEPNDTIVLDKVFIIGYKKTKEQIIRRELSLRDGQVLTRHDLDLMVEEDKRRLLNTQLFLSVDASIVELSNERVDVIYRLSERWYFFPVPIFNLADRNFTEWWVNQNADFSRVEWGLRLRHFNFRGRRELLNLTAQFGYTRLFRISYAIPYINKNQKLGISFYGDYAVNKNIAYKTLNHRQQFLDADEPIRDRWRGGVAIGYRPNFYSTHTFGLHYSGVAVEDTVVQENPNYFPDGKNTQQYLALSYGFRWDFRDFISYPLSGAFFRLRINQIGLGLFDDVSILSLNARYSKYVDLGKKFYFSTSTTINASTPATQPYYNYQSIGTNGDFMRGFERNIVEGQHYIINKNTLKRQIFSTQLDLSRKIRWDEFNKIPFAAYLTLNFDQGYAHNYPSNEANTSLSDRYIFGGGIGIDLITFYDFVMRWEYSANIQGDRALYFNLFAPF
jgi:outer membrane protein assembly factor BamA